MSEMPIPVPTIEEQREIVRKIEVAFDWIDRLNTEADSARRLVDPLDQAIFAKAFRGELVPQDPNDEPASVLLERIRTERAVKSSTKRASQKKSEGRKTKRQRAVKSSTKRAPSQKKSKGRKTKRQRDRVD